MLATRRFLPVFCVQVLGALNDNLFKNALLILMVYRLGNDLGFDGKVLASAAAALFILPFVVFSALGGQLADKMDKATLICWTKGAEVLAMVVGAYGLVTGNVAVMLGVLFLMGTQSAFFGPVKYSILPDHLAENELIGANSLIEAGTFLAILIGTIAGGLIILADNGPYWISGATVGVAAIGFAGSFLVPTAPSRTPDLRIDPNLLRETANIIGHVRQSRAIKLSILGISWFWLLGATFISQFPAFAQSVIGGDQSVVTLFLILFTIGIAVGSLACNKLLKGEVTAKYVPFGAVGMTLFILDLYFACHDRVFAGGDLISAGAFLSAPENWRILGDLFAVSIFGGLFIVPLYAILQTRSEAAHRSRTIAANNIVNALFIVTGALIATALLAVGTSLPGIILVLAISNAIVTVYVFGLLPDEMVKVVLKTILKICYRIEVTGRENYREAGPRAVIVVNHVSFLDAVLLAVYLPVKPMFAINTHIAQAWWVKPFLALIDAYPMDSTNPMATKGLIKAVQEDRHCVIFPEGRITVTGALMKVYEGPGMIADKADAMIVPVRIDGAQYTPFSRLRGKIRLRWFPKITITFLKPRRFEIAEDIKGRERRRMAGVKLYDLMSEMIFETTDRSQTLYAAMLEAKGVHGGGQPVAEDIERKPMSYARLILGSTVLGRKLCRFTKKAENVGVMLPNSLGAVTTFFALQAYGRVPAKLNFSTGSKNMVAAIETAGIQTVLTSRRFIEAAKLEETVGALAEKASIVYLEDIRGKVGMVSKLAALMTRPFAGLLHARQRIRPGDPAVILFTSGSEGTPKGVVLSHENLLANRNQLAARVDFNPTDIVFNALPMFHSFGLTGGTLLPILSGIKTFLYPSPLHYRIVPPLAYDTNATILFGTDTFLSGYARVGHPYDFYAVRYVFAGAERVKEETRRVWMDKFGLRILEGYGATETAPVIAVNTPMHFQAGSVGRPVPGLACTLEKVPGIEEGGKLIVSGPNVMLGYLRHENPGVLEPVEDQRYDTGDIVTIDAHGFITIRGRAKRFAKIAGEMVSLSAVENHAATIWPDYNHAVVSIPDARKGEQLVLVTDNPDADRQSLLDHAKKEGISELMVPKDIRTVASVPLLGTGKIDYTGVKEIAEGSSG
ncbi:acyl-[ACP]--phospholipid O-acyltransferase [Hwanghaeella grinnelliae]|uniref:Acyl-[ACP]--phospholipid O-acyltransferase n=1 Tax=Hwanghaeella grinnelliae TaxID=2500179 RepID=A0A3S2W8C5_9PROT|nr:acyl-[ACP]--phospholipid O-acyltransferase [Hwanghaeella grinnelliae]